MFEFLGAGLGFIGNLMNNAAAERRQKQMMDHLREVEAWQRNDRATALTAVSAARQKFQQDPNRAKVRSKWNARLENPSALTDEAVSSTKANALSSNALNFAEGSRRMKVNAQRAGIAGSGFTSALDSAFFQGANRDAQNLSANIDLGAAKTRKADADKALAEYTDFNNSELDREYSFTRDANSILSGTQYGNSLALTGM